MGMMSIELDTAVYEMLDKFISALPPERTTLNICIFDFECFMNASISTDRLIFIPLYLICDNRFKFISKFSQIFLLAWNISWMLP